ncbi:MAG TPA: Rrf2 family transcriptional regulator [Ignavibacteriales bacterium]|nr:Rrf2 family transcriptional regulator [Ignavibacteriales bacterium]
MSASTKLSSAVKALTRLAKSYPKPISSSELSASTGINASKLRMLFTMLTKDGIASSGKGAAGGFVLNRKPEEINLQQIYCAIEDRKAFHLDVNSSKNGRGEESARMNEYFLDLFADIQKDIEAKMTRITLKDIMDEINQSKN